MTHRLASVTALATLVLIVAGGLVTNTGAALAVPDWPTTFGRNMFLFPWSEMVGGVFYEHSHRLLGALVGLLTVMLAAVLWLTEPRGWLRGLGAVAVGAVCLQGLLGGLRVLLVQDALAVVHGCLAQAFFALIVALAVFTSPRWRAGATVRADARGLARLAATVTAMLYLQIVFGALTTHAGQVGLHLAGAVVAVVAAGGLVLRLLRRDAAAPDLVGPARAVALLLVLQLALGGGAYAARFTDLAVPGGALGTLLMPVAHRVSASLLLGAAVVLTLTLWRLAGAASIAGRPVAGSAVVSPGVSA